MKKIQAKQKKRHKLNKEESKKDQAGKAWPLKLIEVQIIFGRNGRYHFTS